MSGEASSTSTSRDNDKKASDKPRRKRWEVDELEDPGKRSRMSAYELQKKQLERLMAQPVRYMFRLQNLLFAEGQSLLGNKEQSFRTSQLMCLTKLPTGSQKTHQISSVFTWVKEMMCSNDLKNIHTEHDYLHFYTLASMHPSHTTVIVQGPVRGRAVRFFTFTVTCVAMR